MHCNGGEDIANASEFVPMDWNANDEQVIDSICTLGYTSIVIVDDDEDDHDDDEHHHSC